VKKHQKPVPQVRLAVSSPEAPIDVSNVALFNSATGKADRVGFRIEDGKKVRFFKSTGELVK
jgi:large subunit ribosomal protein L24